MSDDRSKTYFQNTMEHTAHEVAKAVVVACAGDAAAPRRLGSASITREWAGPTPVDEWTITVTIDVRRKT